MVNTSTPQATGAPARRVMLIDDSSAVRVRLADLLTRTGAVQIIAQAANISAARDLLNTQDPDTIIVDLEMPGGGGLDLIAELRNREPTPLVIVLTNHPTAEYRARSLALGAHHFLDKTLEFQNVPAILQQLAPRPDHSDGTPAAEMARLLSLMSYQILDTPAESAFDDLTALVAQICATPIALISLVDADRQWFKSRHGLNTESTARSISFCHHAIAGDELFVVQDATCDERFADNPLVTGDPLVRFYAGVPLKVNDGNNIGTLCVIDHVPRVLTAAQVEALSILARQVVARLEYRRLALDLQVAHEARQVAERKLEALAMRDDLTGLANRASFLHDLEHAITLGLRQGRRLACLYMDLDNFKLVNDSLGHPVGDALLIAATQRIRDTVRESDIVARLGGDEFGIVLLNVEAVADVAHIAEKLIARLTASYEIAGQIVHVGCTVGISMCPNDSLRVDTLIQQADTALYHAKARGKGDYKFFAPVLNETVKARRRLELDVREAITHRLFELHYQPQYRCDGQTLVGVEALIRWPRSGQTAVSPAVFLPLADELQLGDGLGAWVIGTACAQFSQWQSMRCSPARLAINVAASQLREGFVEFVLDTLRAHGLSPTVLELEITESQILRDYEQAKAIISQLRGHGVGFALDDFGTGYSSLTLLKDLQVDALKIDRSFVHDIAAGNGDATIVSALIALAHRLRLRVTAEGVETAAQLVALRGMACDEFQGFLLSPALASAQLVEFLAAGNIEYSEPIK